MRVRCSGGRVACDLAVAAACDRRSVAAVADCGLILPATKLAQSLLAAASGER